MKEDEHQLGDFINGRLKYIEKYCSHNNLDYEDTLDDIMVEAKQLAETPERREFIEFRFIQGAVLATSILPDWLDRVLLEAMTTVLGGPNAPRYTSTSRETCIPFEAGRFNAHRQADTIFKILYSNKKPEVWLKSTFKVLYQKCYGDEAARGCRIDEVGPHHFRVFLTHNDLEKASPIDCATIIGYLYGSMERLNADNPVVNHEVCSTLPNSDVDYCVFDITWEG